MNIQQLLGIPGLGGRGAAAQTPQDGPVVDTAETIHISSLALLKMLKHGQDSGMLTKKLSFDRFLPYLLIHWTIGRAGVPMEVMGLMIGEFVDDYTVRCVDVFAMPQLGTSVSIESVDPVMEAKMTEMLKQVGRPESVIGWYHSHPGFGCWLSNVDMNTQQSFENLHPRAVAVVIDPIQSVKGKVVIDAFRLINTNLTLMGQEARQTTSNLGHLQKPSLQALIHGLNRHYYSLAINYRKNELEQKMLANLHKKKWTEGLSVADYHDHAKSNAETVKEMLELAKGYQKYLQEEDEIPEDKLKVQKVGKLDPKKHLEINVQKLLSDNITQTLGTMLDTVVF